MTPIDNGYYCNECNKAVIDYSNMTDAEMIAHINKHGMGCGSFHDDQLNRELVPLTKRKGNRLFYLPLLATLFGKPLTSKAQSVPDTIQAPCKQVSYDKLQKHDTLQLANEQTQITANHRPIKRMGTGNVCKTVKRTTYGIYWGWLRLPLFIITKAK